MKARDKRQRPKHTRNHKSMFVSLLSFLGTCNIDFVGQLPRIHFHDKLALSRTTQTHASTRSSEADTTQQKFVQYEYSVRVVPLNDLPQCFDI
jgi:hypothetical protein